MALESYSRTGEHFLQDHVDYLEDRSQLATATNGRLRHKLAVQSKTTEATTTLEDSPSAVHTVRIPTTDLHNNTTLNNALHQLIPACAQPARILVADDNLMVRTCLMNLLDRWGMSYQLCANGLSAWQALQDNEFDLLLIDLQMPGMDGHQLVAQLRNTPTNSNSRLPIVALAGTDSAEAKIKMFDAGTNAFLSKPFCPQELNKTMLRFLKLSPTQQSGLIAEPIDETMLFELYENDYEHRYMMFDLFLRNTPEAMEAIKRAVAAEDVSVLQREIHKVKPTFAMVGLQQTGQLAESIENQLQKTNNLGFGLRKEIGRFKLSVQKALEFVRIEQQSIAKSLK